MKIFFLMISFVLVSCGKVEVATLEENPSQDFQYSSTEELTEEEKELVDTICRRSLEATAKIKLQVGADKVYSFDSTYTGCDEKVYTKEVQLGLKMEESKLEFSPIGMENNNKDFYFKDFANIEHSALSVYCKNTTSDYLRFIESGGITTKSKFSKGIDCDDNSNMICFKFEHAIANEAKQYKVLHKETFKFMVKNDHKFDGLVVKRSTKDYELCQGSQVVEKSSTLTQID